jgi:hypothetical protein
MFMSGERERRKNCRRHRVWRWMGVRLNQRRLEENSRERWEDELEHCRHKRSTRYPFSPPSLDCRSESRFVTVCTSSDKTSQDRRNNHRVDCQNINSPQDKKKWTLLAALGRDLPSKRYTLERKKLLPNHSPFSTKESPFSSRVRLRRINELFEIFFSSLRWNRAGGNTNYAIESGKTEEKYWRDY